MKKIQLCTCVFFLLFVFGFSFLQLLPDKSFSDQENRVLAQVPEWSIEAAASGQFSDQMEEYASDQFPFRNMWILINHLYERALMKLEIGGNYVLSDRIIQQFRVADEQNIKKSISKINDFSLETGKNIDLLLIPTASAIDREHLSSFANEVDQQALLSQIESQLIETVQMVNVYDALDASEKDVYYATDHHYNEHGAYLVYQAYMNHLGKEPSEFTFETVSDSFCGTLYSSSGAFYMKGDEIVRMDPVEEVEVRVEYEQNGEVFDSIFHEENLDRKDQYTYYLDGNHSIVEIETSNSQAPSLLVIADSYSHLMIPYLISDFSKIEVVDLRYYRNVISDHSEEFDQILVLYSLENLSEDDGLSWLR